MKTTAKTEGNFTLTEIEVGPFKVFVSEGDYTTVGVIYKQGVSHDDDLIVVVDDYYATPEGKSLGDAIRKDTAATVYLGIARDGTFLPDDPERYHLTQTEIERVG